MTDAGLTYRPGLTHLRALSVVLVLLFHAGLVTSGYIGVDVFFVLSGFLISSILWDGLSSEQSGGRVLARFYARRCLRILPLSILVLVVTAVAARLFFDTLIDNWVSAGRAALVWSENWFLIRESNDYFAAQGTNPFQQYWSLGVEEQFYIALPLLLMLLMWMLRRCQEQTRLLALGIASALGVALALASYQAFDLSVSEFYYSSFTRSYQLLTGVAIMALSRRFDLRQDRRWVAAVGAAGLVLVGTVLDLSLMWTGLLATGFAALCVLSSEAVLVDNRWLERIGLWSYGIYLWHFPINAYLVHERLHTPAWVAFVVTFAAATALSALTFHFFENPVRRLDVSPAATFVTTAAAIGGAWIALGLLAPPPTRPVFVDPAQADERAALPVAPDGTVDLSSITPSGRLAADAVRRIDGWMDATDTALNTCDRLDPASTCVDIEGSPNVMLIGDSFASRIYQALRPLAEEQAWGFSTFARPGCPWMDDVFNDVKDDFADRCAQKEGDLAEVVAEVQPDVIVVHSYPYRATDRRMTRASTDEVMTEQEVADAANATIDEWVTAGIRVVYVEPTPYATHSFNADECLEVATWADECDFEPVEIDGLLNQAMEERAAHDPMVWFTSINDQFCTDGVCRSTLGDLAVMGDRTHTSGGLWMKLRNLLLAPIQDAAGAS